MKIVSGSGKGIGKLGGDVYYINHGVQLKREYTSQVTNPNTPQQVGQRTRFKLQSQISASVAPVLAFVRKGMVSPRNQFVKVNNGNFYVSQGVAQVALESLQIARGNLALPNVVINKSEQNVISMYLGNAPSIDISRIVYCLFDRTVNGDLAYLGSVIVSNAGTLERWRGTWTNPWGVVYNDLLVLAYGMRDNNERARAAYENYHIETAEDVARLVASRSLDLSNYSFTQTMGATLFEGETTSGNILGNQVVVRIMALTGGIVTGTGFENGQKIVNVGDSVTVTATPDNGMQFNGWKYEGTNEVASNVSAYTFDASRNVSLVASFVPSGGLE